MFTSYWQTKYIMFLCSTWNELSDLGSKVNLELDYISFSAFPIDGILQFSSDMEQMFFEHSQVRK